MGKLRIEVRFEYRGRVPAQVSGFVQLETYCIPDGWSQGDEHYGCSSTSLSTIRSKSRQ